MERPEPLIPNGHSEQRIPLGDAGQEATLAEGLSSQPMRELLGKDALETYRRSLTELGCPVKDIQRNSEGLRQVDADRRVAIAYTARVGAASIKGKAKSRK